MNCSGDAHYVRAELYTSKTIYATLSKHPAFSQNKFIHHIARKQWKLLWSLSLLQFAAFCFDSLWMPDLHPSQTSFYRDRAKQHMRTKPYASMHLVSVGHGNKIAHALRSNQLQPVIRKHVTRNLCLSGIPASDLIFKAPSSSLLFSSENLSGFWRPGTTHNDVASSLINKTRKPGFSCMMCWKWIWPIWCGHSCLVNRKWLSVLRGHNWSEYPSYISITTATKPFQTSIATHVLAHAKFSSFSA